MSVHAARGPRPGRVAALLAYDGAVATTMVAVFQLFVVAVSFLACLAPAFLFSMLVGWQLTHLALWLGALSMCTVVPATFALIAASRRELLVPGATRAGRAFWRAFATGAQRLWWLAAGLSGVIVLLGYDLALVGADDGATLGILAVAAVVALMTVGICVVAEADEFPTPIALIATALRRMCRRPHVPLSWGLLITLGVAVTQIPIIGASTALIVPSLVGAAIAICNRALEFEPNDQEHAA